MKDEAYDELAENYEILRRALIEINHNSPDQDARSLAKVALEEAGEVNQN